MHSWKYEYNKIENQMRLPAEQPQARIQAKGDVMASLTARGL
jgi:hypothetical protein